MTSSSGLNDLSCFLTRNFATNPKSISTATAMPVTIKNLFIRTTLYGSQNKVNKLKTFFESLLKITGNGLFLRVKNQFMDVASWWPFFVVIALFILAIVSPWIFPNKMVSKNKHDNKY